MRKYVKPMAEFHKLKAGKLLDTISGTMRTESYQRNESANVDESDWQ